jgi:hypothetical protein
VLGLPPKAEVSKMLPKKAIYEKFNMNTAQKAKFDADISRINIVGEITPTTVQIAEGKTVQCFYILQIILKNKKYDEKAIAGLQKLIPQRMIFLLQYENDYCLAYYQNRHYHTEWTALENLSVVLNGIDMDAAWANTVKAIVCNEECGVWDEEMTLDENLANLEEHIRIKKEIARLEAMARKEKQPKKKFELVQAINQLKNSL